MCTPFNLGTEIIMHEASPNNMSSVEILYRILNMQAPAQD